MEKEKGFTLIEMLIVLLVITILLLITIPNVTKHNSSIQKKGCDGLINMVQAQVSSYQIDHKEIPTIEELKSEGYLRNTPVCPNGNTVVIAADGVVSDGGAPAAD